MKKFLLFFSILFVIFLFPKETFAKTGIELSSSNGTVLYSQDTTETTLVNVNNVKFIIFYFNLDLTTMSKYTLNNEFLYSTQGTTGNGVQLSWLLINNKSYSFDESYTTILQEPFEGFFHHKYINHISFTSTQSGSVQVQLTYTLSREAFVGSVGISKLDLTFEGSTSSDTNDVINSSTTNIINNQNQNQQQTNDRLDKIDENQKETNDLIKDDNVDGAKDEASSFFEDFKTDDFGLSGIITAPLETIKSITSKTCNPLVLPLPFVNENLTLPCIRSIFEDHFNIFLKVYQTITFGIISYYVCVRIFNLVKDFKNPEHDEIEVMDL